MLIRRFTAEDAEQLSQLIKRTLRKVNSRDYSMGAIESLIPFFRPESLIQKASEQYMIVCIDAGDLVGVAALDGDRVRTVFVDADRQRRGIGKLLMADIEARAIDTHQTRLYLHAALSAENFYQALGFEAIGPIDRELNGFPVPEVEMAKKLDEE
jgi:N-acetylglutamate synthase-like GNAT family acetyltransferase